MKALAVADSAGLVGLLLRARRAGHLRAVTPSLTALAAAGFHIAPALRLEALRRAGE